MHSLGERLRNFRRSKGLTQAAVAAHLGKTRESVSLWERGERVPSLEDLVELARLFGRSLDDLVIGPDEGAGDAATHGGGDAGDVTERLLDILDRLTRNLEQREETERLRIREAEETRRLEILEVAQRQQRSIERLITHLLGDDASARAEGRSEQAATTDEAEAVAGRP